MPGRRDWERETRLRGSDGIQLGGAVIWKIGPNAEDFPLLAPGQPEAWSWRMIRVVLALNATVGS